MGEPDATVVLTDKPMPIDGMGRETLRDYAMTNGGKGALPNGCVVEKDKNGLSAYLTHWERGSKGVITVWLYRSPDAYDSWRLSVIGKKISGYTDSGGYMGVPPRHAVVGERKTVVDEEFCRRNLREHARY